MKFILLSLVAVIIVAPLYFQLSDHSEERNSDIVSTDSVQIEPAVVEVTEPQLVFKSEAVELMYPGGPEMINYEVAYIDYGDDTIRVFSDKIARIDFQLLSQDKDFIYFSKGMGRSDAGVQSYVFDLETRTLHVVCELEDTVTDICERALSFGGQHLLDVRWEESGLVISYENPGLRVGVDESGPAVGTEIYQSVSAEAPWLVYKET